MKLQKKAGVTGEIWQIFVANSASTTGAGLTGLTNSTSGLTAAYHRDTDSNTTNIALLTMNSGVYTSNGLVEVNTNLMGGWYQFCPANAALAAGAKSVGFHLQGAANMAPLPIEVQLMAADPDDGVRLGLTALPNAAAQAAGGLYTQGSGAGQINQSANGLIDVNVTRWNSLNTVALPLVPTVAGRTLDVSAGGEAGLDWANVGSPTTVLALTGTTIATTQQVVANLVRSGTAQAGGGNQITLDAGASATNDLYKGLVVLLTGGTGAGQARTIITYGGATKVCTVDRNWITNPGATSTFTLLAADNPSLTAALAVTAAVSKVVILSGTAQTGSTANTIKLSSTASSTNNLYNGDLVTITGGTGLGQTRTIISYVGSTKVATLDKAWNTTPDNTSTFDIYASTTPSVFSDQGVIQAANSTTATLAATASASNSVYNGSLLTILSGTGAAQTREITGYVGSTKVATVDSAWSVNPDTTSAYAVIPTDSGSGSVGGTQDVNVISWAGTAVSTTVAGFPRVDLAYWVGVAPLALSSQQVQAVVPITQQVDVNTIKTNPVVSAGTVTFPTNATLASTTNITAGTITTVTTVTTLTTYTGNTPQTGDSFARIGAAGVGLTAVGLAGTQTFNNTGTWTGNVVGTVSTVTTLTNLPAIPTDWITAAGVSAAAVTKIQAGLATPTNITAGTITTVTTLTNLPAVTTDWLTAAGVAANAVTKIQAGLSTYAGGDTSGTTTLLVRLSALRAGYLDNLSAGPVMPAGNVTVGGYAINQDPAALVLNAVAASYNAVNTIGRAINVGGSAGGGNVTVGGYAAGQDPATLVLDVLAANHNTASTIGAAIQLAGAGGVDPLAHLVPDGYASGTAGAALGRIGSGQITTVSNISQGGLIVLVRGDDYKAADGEALDWVDVDAAWPALTSAAVSFGVNHGALIVTGSVITPTGAGKTVRAEPTAAQTASLSAGTYTYQVTATLADSNRVTLVSGFVRVLERDA